MTDLPTTDPARIVELHQRLIDSLREQPEVAASLRGEPAVINIRLTEPDINLKLTLAGDETALVAAGSDDPDPDVTISMSWRVANEFWAGALDLMAALMTGKIKIEGPNMDPLFRLKTLVPAARETYNRLLTEMKDA